MQLTLAYHAKSLTDGTVCFERCDLFTGPYQGVNDTRDSLIPVIEADIRASITAIPLKVGRIWEAIRELTGRLLTQKGNRSKPIEKPPHRLH
jgi:hypothetical protein